MERARGAGRVQPRASLAPRSPSSCQCWKWRGRTREAETRDTRVRRSDALPAATPSENQHRVLSPPHILLSGLRSKIRAAARISQQPSSYAHIGRGGFPMPCSTYLSRIAAVGAIAAILGALTCPAAAVSERRTSAAQRQSLTVI